MNTIIIITMEKKYIKPTATVYNMNMQCAILQSSTETTMNYSNEDYTDDTWTDGD